MLSKDHNEKYEHKEIRCRREKKQVWLNENSVRRYQILFVVTIILLFPGYFQISPLVVI